MESSSQDRFYTSAQVLYHKDKCLSPALQAIIDMSSERFKSVRNAVDNLCLPIKFSNDILMNMNQKLKK